MVNSTRTEAMERVLNAVAKAGLSKANLYGSWLHGDFHYDETKANSVSDIDLVLPGRNGRDRDSVAQAVQAHLPAHFVSEVTTRTEDDLHLMQLDKQHWYVLSGYTAILKRCGPGQLSPEYSLCKTLLLLGRIHQQERYRSVAERIGTQSAFRALQVKLGSRTSIADKDVRELARKVPGPHRDVLTELLQRNPRFQSVAEYIMSSLTADDGSVPESVLEHAKRRLFGR